MRPCMCTARVVNTAVWGVYTALYGSCTWPSMYTARVHGRVCIRPVYTAVCMARTRPTIWRGRVYGHVQAVYTSVYKDHLHSRVRAVYTCTRPSARPCTGRVHDSVRVVLRAVHRAVIGQCTARAHVRPCVHKVRVHGCVHGPYTAVYTYTYTAVTRPCTCRPHGRVHGRYRAVYGP